MSEVTAIFRNSNGQIKFDARNPIYVEDQSGTATTAFVPGISGYYNVSVSLNSCPKPHLIAIQPPTAGAVCFKGLSKTGDNYTSFNVGNSEIDGALTFNWKSYIAYTPTGTATHGLRLRNSSGEILYESDQTPISVLDVIPVTIGNSHTDYNDIYHPGISDPYYIIGPEGYLETPTGGYYTYFKTALKKLSAEYVRFCWASFGKWEVGASYISNPGYKLMLCA